MNECKACGYRWGGRKNAPHCPNCKTERWDKEPEPESCNLGGGSCDICGCKFVTIGLFLDHHCPNCGSKRWAHISTDNRRRLEDLHPWIMEKTKGKKTYTYWMASWREGDKVRNVHLGSCKKLSQSDALQKARTMKAKALGLES